MFRILAFALLIALPGVSLARPQLSLGTALEARVQREINPAFAELKTVGQLFAQLRFTNWVAHAELGEEYRDTNSGALSISTRSINSGVWGRYHFMAERRYRPFAGGGVGAFFDRVSSDFKGARDQRSGLRPYTGMGGGISVVFWDHFLLEAEGRAAMVRDRREPIASALFRMGFNY